MTLGDLDFLIKDPGGTVGAIQGGLGVVSSSGALLGTYNIDYYPHVSSWSPGTAANTSLRDGDAVIVYSTGPSAESLVGFQLFALGMNEFSGGISAPFV